MSLTAARPITYLITRGGARDHNFASASSQILDIISLAVAEKVSMIQIREKHLSSRLLCELSEAAVVITRGSQTKVLVNDRADIAKACGADGVHLAANSVPANVIRKIFPENFLIGVSAHSLNDVKTAARLGVDFAVLAPVFATPEKGTPLGLEKFHEICGSVHPFPVLGLGGVGAANFAEVLGAGAIGIAAIRGLNDPESLRAITNFPG